MLLLHRHEIIHGSKLKVSRDTVDFPAFLSVLTELIRLLAAHTLYCFYQLFVSVGSSLTKFNMLYPDSGNEYAFTTSKYRLLEMVQ